MHRRVQRAPWWMVAVTVLATVAGACTSSTPSTAPSAATSSGPSTSAAAPASAPASAPAEATTETSPAPSTASGGGIVSIGSQGDIQYFDPALAYDTVSWIAARLLYDQLVEYDPTSTKLVPGLAKEMPTVSADGRTYTFHLRSGVKFYKGDGSVLREMNADDVVASLNRILDQGFKPNPSPVGPAFFSIIDGSAPVLAGTAKTASGIKAVDPLTVEITLTNPDKRLPYILAMMFGSVVPAESPSDATAFGAAPIGTGPYHLVEYKQGQLARFERNADYWGSAPANAGVELRIGLDANTQLQQTEANQLDLMSDPIPGGSYTATINDPTFKDRILRRTDVALYYMSIDTSGPDKALANVKVRQAMNHAVDKANQVRLQNGRGGPSTCILPPPMPGYDATCDPYPHDIDKAKALMKEAGYEAGFKTTLYTYTDDTIKAQAEAIQQDLAQIGITADIVQQEFSVLLGTMSTPHTAPLVLIGWFQDFPDPSDFIDPILSCATAVQGGSNIAWYCNEEIDAASAAALAEQDDATRLSMYQDIQKKIMADAPWVPTVLSETVIMSSNRVGGTNPLHQVYPLDARNVTISQ